MTVKQSRTSVSSFYLCPSLASAAHTHTYPYSSSTCSLLSPSPLQLRPLPILLLALLDVAIRLSPFSLRRRHVVVLLS